MGGGEVTREGGDYLREVIYFKLSCKLGTLVCGEREREITVGSNYYSRKYNLSVLLQQHSSMFVMLNSLCKYPTQLHDDTLFELL